MTILGEVHDIILLCFILNLYIIVLDSSSYDEL